MNHHLRMPTSTSPAYVDWLNPAAAPASLDRPRAHLDVTADLTIGSAWVAEIEGRVWVYRDGDEIMIDDVVIYGQRSGRQSRIGIGSQSATMRLRTLTGDEMQEHLCWCAFENLLDDPRFTERAEEALSAAESEWAPA